MELSKRMQAVADLVPAGSVAADVGCDHGFVSIYLVRKGICPHVYAADVRPGPLGRAREHIAACGLEDRITAVLSDGLKAVPVGVLSAVSAAEEAPAGANVMIAAGMGGRLTVRILSDVPEKTARLAAVVLEPQSEVWLVRRWLREHGFVITAEAMVLEDGKYYPVIRAVNAAAEENAGCAGEASACLQRLKAQLAAEGLTQQETESVCDGFGPMLLADRSAVLLSFLEHTIEKDRALLAAMPDPGINREKDGAEAENGRAARIAERIDGLQRRIRLGERVRNYLRGYENDSSSGWKNAVL